MATIIGTKVNTKGNIGRFSKNLNISKRIQGAGIDATAIQNTSIAKLESDMVEPIWNMLRIIHPIMPVYG
jgi:hypothetical protein